MTLATDEFLKWLADILRDSGPGEYIVQLKTDGSAVVKRPRRPVRYNYHPERLVLERDVRRDSA